ncbi:hypothetical protein C8Q79DRAFT_1011303 [Trametes meyenii]|nr:hypothetical protein C8Q79DRAFT_1011303 [Trametes meyenii]
MQPGEYSPVTQTGTLTDFRQQVVHTEPRHPTSLGSIVELILICHLVGETVLLLAQWYCALVQDVEVYDRWFRTARRVFSLHPHLMRGELSDRYHQRSYHYAWSRSAYSAGMDAAARCVLALGSPDVFAVALCAMATCVVDLLQWYHTLPLMSSCSHGKLSNMLTERVFVVEQESVKNADPYLALLRNSAILPLIQ